jgi:hypothetical protein
MLDVGLRQAPGEAELGDDCGDEVALALRPLILQS